MPHIHTGTGECDATVSAYVVRRVADEWRCLVHMHRKIDRLMQIGGHIELTQTPWQAVATELREEAGYELAELKVLQSLPEPPELDDAVVHPQPFLMNTHDVGGGHYHNDTCYGFSAEFASGADPDADESQELRWLTLDELQKAAERGEALQDTTDIYTYLLSHIESLHAVPASAFSVDKPTKGITYKR
jgi:8-oxo-dGTP diphosphatase